MRLDETMTVWVSTHVTGGWRLKTHLQTQLFVSQLDQRPASPLRAPVEHGHAYNGRFSWTQSNSKSVERAWHMFRETTWSSYLIWIILAMRFNVLIMPLSTGSVVCEPAANQAYNGPAVPGSTPGLLGSFCRCSSMATSQNNTKIKRGGLPYVIFLGGHRNMDSILPWTRTLSVFCKCGPTLGTARLL